MATLKEEREKLERQVNRMVQAIEGQSSESFMEQIKRGHIDLEERASNLPLPFAEGMRLLQYSEHTAEDKIRIMWTEGQPITKADVLRIFTEELEFNFDKHILPQLASGGHSQQPT